MHPVVRSARFKRFVRFAVGSLFATGVSAVTLALMYDVLHTGPVVASITAFASGAIVNFVANRFWAWSRHERVGLGRDMASYAVLAVSTALLAAGVTKTTEWYAKRSTVTADHLGLIVEVSYFATYAAMFVVKFVVLDRVVFRSRAQVEKTTRA